MGTQKLLHGDCLELMKELPDKSIDMILCDLPYETTRCRWDVIIDFKLLWKQYKRIIKDNGAIVLTSAQPFTSKLIMSNLEMFRYCWIWNKGKGSNFIMVKKQPLRIHEEVLIFGNCTYNPQMTENKKYRDRRNENWLKQGTINRKGATTPKGIVSYSKNYNPSLLYPKSIIKINNHLQKEKRLHPTQKPVALMEYLIKTYTNEGNLVLDNCMGSGTTGVACKNLNRDFIGMELDEKYFNIAKQRIEDSPKP
jgi:site-specific DNA-methyltransferase (adenine-specific)